MVFKEREELYLALPKKGLQKLCRAHGLPSNTTKGRLAKLLVDHFNRRASSKANPKARLERGRPPLPAPLAAEKSEDISKEGGASQVHGRTGSIVPKGKPNFAKNNDVNAHHIHYEKEDSDCRQLGYSCQDGFMTNNAFQKLPLTQRGKTMKSNEISSGSGLASSSGMFVAIPASFQFFVRSDEGIGLYVDLNSSPFNWLKRMNDEVSINQKTHKDRSWSIYHELKGSGVKGMETSYPDNIDVFINIEEPSTKGSDEKKESNKSSLTSVVHDGSVDTIEFPFEGYLPSTSCAISSGVENCNNYEGPQCSVLAQKSTQNTEKDSVANDRLVLLDSPLEHNICIHTEHVQRLSNDQILYVNSDCHNAQSISQAEPLIHMFEKSNVTPKTFSGGVTSNGECIHMHPEDGLYGNILLTDGVLENIMPLNQLASEQPIPKSHSDIIHSDWRGLVEDIPQEQRCGSLASPSPIIDNMGLGPSEEQCNKPYVKEKVSSGGDKIKKMIYTHCRRSSPSDLSKLKRQRTSAEVSEGSMIVLRSINASASHASFPRRSMRLVSK